MNTPCVSIIVPIYNVSSYLRECIESIINQNYKNLQIILVDDGSTDESGLICDEYKNVDNRIEVIHQNNMGLVGARKSGLERAIGEYIGFVDGDDYIDENMYGCLLEYILKEKADMVHTGYWCDTGEEQYLKTDFVSENICKDTERMNLIGDLLDMRTNVEPSIWSKLFKKSVIKSSYSTVNLCCSYGEDLVCFLDAIANSEKICLINKAFYHYRLRKISLSHGLGVDGIQKEVILRNNIREILIKNNLYEMYKESLELFFGKNIVRKMRSINLKPFATQTYYYDDPQCFQRKRVVIYGAGNVGKDYYSQFCRYTNCNVVAWIDQKADKIDIPYIKILAPDQLDKIQYDYVIIAVLEEYVGKKIAEELLLLGVDESKIVWKKPAIY